MKISLEELARTIRLFVDTNGNQVIDGGQAAAYLTTFDGRTSNIFSVHTALITALAREDAVSFEFFTNTRERVRAVKRIVDGEILFRLAISPIDNPFQEPIRDP